MSAQVCTSCGAELESGAMFCAECGARVTAVPPSPVVPYPHAAAPYSPLPPVPPSGPVAPAPGPYATTPPAPGPHAASVASPPGGASGAYPPPPAPSPSPARAAAEPTMAPPPPPGPAPAAPAEPDESAGQAAAAGASSGPATRAATRVGEAFPVVPGSVAPVGRRVGAFAIDGVALLLLGGVGVAIMLATAGEPEVSPASVTASFVPSLLVGIGGIALWVSESVTGATLGGALLGIRTVSAQTGRPAGLLRILLRQLVVGLGALACGVGQWLVVSSGVFDKTPAQRGWHDKAAGTLVLLADATGVARAQDPARAWDQAVARAVGPVPPPPPSPAPASSSVPSVPSVPSPVPPPPPAPAGPAFPPPATPAPVTAPAATPAAGTAAAGASAPSAGASAPSAGAPDVDAPPTIGLVPLPPGVGTGRPSASPAGSLITGFPGSRAEQPPAEATTGTSEPLAGDTLSSQTLGDTPATGHELIGSPVAHPMTDQMPAVAPATDRHRAPDPRPEVAPTRWNSEELDEIELTRLRTPATGIHPVPLGLRLVFDTGERIDVVGDGLVGRDPQGDVEHRVAIDDPARSLSKTHLAFGLAAPGDLWVVDRGSTNGTVVVRPDGAAAALPPGMRAVVTVGWSLRLGERTVRVESR